MAQIVAFPGTTIPPQQAVVVQPEITADDILQDAAGVLDSVIVLGVRLDGSFHLTSSLTSQEILWLIENAKMSILLGDDDE